MALYKYAQYFGQSQDEAFDQLYGPGVRVPRSGIYRCQGCQREIAANEGGDPFPPQNHHQHPQQTPIQWRLAVYAQN